MIKYIIYTQHACEFFDKAKDLLNEAGEIYEERLLDTPEKIKRFRDAGHKTVPQMIFTLGGYTELEEFMFPPEIEFDQLKLVEGNKTYCKNNTISRCYIRSTSR